MGTEKPKAGRLTFIDLMRGMAIVFMVETHVVNAMMVRDYRSMSWFAVLNFVNGLVAPSFIFISGLAFAFTSRRKVDDFRRFGHVFWRQVGRIGLVWLCGYLLRLPYPTLAALKLDGSAKAWNKLFSVDVLHCIAAGLFVLLMVRILVRTRQGFQTAMVYGVCLVFSLPWVLWRKEVLTALPLPIASYLTTAWQSIFPIFPWWAFLFAGAWAGECFARWREEGRENEFMTRALYGSVPLIILGHLWMPLNRYVPSFLHFNPDPFFFICRLGWVLLIMTILYLATTRLNWSGAIFSLAGRESLLVYSFHLQLIYQCLWFKRSFAQVARYSYSPLKCLVISVLMIVLMLLAAVGWGKLKATHPNVARWATTVLIGGIVLVFLFWPTPRIIAH